MSTRINKSKRTNALSVPNISIDQRSSPECALTTSLVNIVYRTVRYRSKLTKRLSRFQTQQSQFIDGDINSVNREKRLC